MIISDLIIAIDMLEFMISDTGQSVGEREGEIVEITLFFFFRHDGREDMETATEIVEKFPDTEMIGGCTERG